MNNNIKVSLIIPVYNNSEFLPRVFDSIDKQSYSDFEVIFVNDGSTDNSKSLIKDYIKRKHNVILIDKNNGGLSSARIEGIKNAKYDYVIFADSDDFFDNDYISNFVHCCDNDADIISSPLIEENIINNHLLSKIIPKPLSKIIILKHDEALHEILSNLIIGNYYPGKMFKKHLFVNTNILYTKPYEDIATIHIIFDKSNKVVVLPQASYHYVRRNNSLSRNDKKSWENKLEALEKRLKYFHMNYNSSDHDYYASMKYLDNLIEATKRYYYGKNHMYYIAKNEYNRIQNHIVNSYIKKNISLYLLSPILFFIISRLYNIARTSFHKRKD